MDSVRSGPYGQIFRPVSLCRGVTAFMLLCSISQLLTCRLFAGQLCLWSDWSW